jgi:A/G-specific adenine glycosylase
VFFPDNYSDLLKLKKGVGEYTAAAVLRFLTMKWFRCGRNVFQVLSRYFDVETDMPWLLPKGVCSFGFQIDAKDNPANQAIMEFGALQCVPKSNCGVCVFNDSCAAHKRK